MDNNLILAFGLTALAGLSTGIGSALAFFTRKTNKRIMSFALGLSAGVMIYVSLVEIIIKARNSLISYHGETKGSWLTVASFFCGILLILIIDFLVPSHENPHEAHAIEEMREDSRSDKRLLRIGIFTAVAIAIHNFPEGLATFAAALNDTALGISIAVAVAIHNIPEGVSVSVPIYFATGNKVKAFWYSFLSGLSEPLGAFVGYFLLHPFFSENTFGILFASVAGIMVYVSLDELIPAAKEFDTGHISILGVIFGMALMAVSLLLFL
ncbi:MAG: zinc transporter ZupT [Deltaproteobacteria bacterium]|nr:zinc transporter ZupT [Deltaproteobacteria bacterium]